MSKPVCEWPLDADGHVPLTEMVEPPGGCLLPEGFRGFYVQQAVKDEYGHPLTGDFDSLGKHGCKHATTHKRKMHRKETKMSDIKDVYLDHAQPVAQESVTESPVTSAEVGVPGFDLSKVLPAGGQLSPAALTLGGFAILGGVLLKVVPSWLRARTDMVAKRLELKAKRMELEQKSKQDEKQGVDCASRHAACMAAVAALEERVKLVEHQADGLSVEVASAKDAATKLSLTGGSSDSDRLSKVEERVAALAKKLGVEPKKDERYDG